jgi:hypothetical protein
VNYSPTTHHQLHTIDASKVSECKSKQQLRHHMKNYPIDYEPQLAQYVAKMID